MQILKEVKKNEKQLINDLCGLLAINSVLVETPNDKEAPFGKGVRESLDYILKLGESFGFKVKNVGNVAGHIEFGEGKDLIGILAHVDVVPAVGNWTYPPFTPTVVDGKIYARGAIDDKGPAIASLYALKIIKDLGLKLNKRVRLIIGTDEESKWRCMDTYFKNEEMPTIGFSPDANFPVIYGEKGILSIDLITNEKSNLNFNSGVRYNVVPSEATAKVSDDIAKEFTNYLKTNNYNGNIENDAITIYGVSAHAMQPEKGINAAILLSKFLKNYVNNNVINFLTDKLTDTRLKAIGLDFTDQEMGDLTMNVGIVEVNENGGRIGLNFRYPINWDKEKFLNEFAKLAKTYNLELKIVSDQNPHYVSKDDELVKILHNAYVYYTNDTITPDITIGGGTYARALKKGVAFGMMFPGREDVVHQVDEYVYIKDLVLATAIYAKAIYDLGK